MFSYQLGINGSVDYIAEFDGELSIIDFKTSKKPKRVSGLRITLFSVKLKAEEENLYAFTK